MLAIAVNFVLVEGQLHTTQFLNCSLRLDFTISSTNFPDVVISMMLTPDFLTALFKCLVVASLFFLGGGVREPGG